MMKTFKIIGQHAGYFYNGVVETFREGIPENMVERAKYDAVMDNWENLQVIQEAF